MHGICQCRGEQETCTAERAGDRDGRVRRVDADVKFVRTTRARCFIPPQHTTGSRGVCSARGYHIMSSTSSSAVASWYCWYPETRSFMLDSASVNSISSMPSPVYQCKKALRRNIAVNCSETRLKSSWMAVELPMKVVAILRPLGGMSHTAVFTLFGIHSTKYDEFLFWTLSICSSTSF